MTHTFSSKLKTCMPHRQDGFFAISSCLIKSYSIATRYRHFWRYFTLLRNTYRHYGITVGLTDTFIKQVKPVKQAGDKHSDGQGMYLLVNSADKYWRLDYLYHGKQKTLALGVYPAVSLAKARAAAGGARIVGRRPRPRRSKTR